MMFIRVLAILGVVAMAGCTGAGPTELAPATSTGAPYGVDQGELESPNSLPVGSTTRDPIATETGVVGVLHLPPTP